MDSLVFPEECKLLSFFESKPELLDPEVPWHYNALTFRCAHADESLTCNLLAVKPHVRILWGT